jgi:hypothetical protein
VPDVPQVQEHDLLEVLRKFDWRLGALLAFRDHEFD